MHEVEPCSTERDRTNWGPAATVDTRAETDVLSPKTAIYIDTAVSHQTLSTAARLTVTPDQRS